MHEGVTTPPLAGEEGSVALWAGWLRSQALSSPTCSRGLSVFERSKDRGFHGSHREAMQSWEWAWLWESKILSLSFVLEGWVAKSLGGSQLSYLEKRVHVTGAPESPPRFVWEKEYGNELNSRQKPQSQCSWGPAEAGVRGQPGDSYNGGNGMLVQTEDIHFHLHIWSHHL